MSDQLLLNPDVLRAWCDTPSHFLPPDLPAAANQHTESGGSSPRRHRYTPAEISQRSVDLLLREYYAMVTAQSHSSKDKAQGSKGSVLQQAFLLLCPALPACLELDHLLKASLNVVELTAQALVLAACILVPLWLGLIRQAWQDKGLAAAAAVAAGGLAVLLLCDAVHRGAARRRSAAQAACVTADTLPDQLHAGGTTTHELATLRAASRTATTSNSSRPSSMTQQSRQQQQQQQQAQPQQSAAAAGARASADSAGGAVTTYAALQQDLVAVQTALGTQSSSRHAPGSREHAVEVLSQLCQDLGVQLTHDMTASPAAMGGVVSLLKQRVGI